MVYRISSGVGTSGDGPLGTVKYQRAGGVLPNVGGITGGPGGRVYFTETSAAIDPPAGPPEEVGSIGVHGGVTAGIPGAPSLPGAVVADREGNLWFLEEGSEEIARMTPAGVITQFPVNVPGLQDITLGPDGNLWFTSADAIGSISPSGTGLRLFPVSVDPDQITAGPDGNLWFTTASTVTTGGREAGVLGRITTAGVTTLFTQGITGQGHLRDRRHRNPGLVHRGSLRPARCRVVLNAAAAPASQWLAHGEPPAFAGGSPILSNRIAPASQRPAAL